ncbi:MAG TPA: SIS domain-containing protein [Longimicrobium sp.]|nr:SIS domain-containing protein [Longimicrobium sp.]
MEPILPEAMLRQGEGLARDLRELAGPCDGQVQALLDAMEPGTVRKVYLTGDGDSYHAACAAAMAFVSLAGVACEPLSALRFAEYAAPFLHDPPPERTLVVAVSASGATPRVVQALERARERGARTIAVTGAAGSPAGKAADGALVLALASAERSPGIRTYQASLLGMLLLAIRLGGARGAVAPEGAEALLGELEGLADMVEATRVAIEGRCREVAEMVAGAPATVMLGSGPNFGTALYAAAKLAEGAGLVSLGQEVEEWWHVERFARPADMPVFVIAPPGRAHWRACEIAEKARERRRRVIAVTDREDTGVARHACAVLPVAGPVREEFSPLVYHLFAGCLAAHVALRLGRTPFEAGALEPSGPAAVPAG